MQTREYQKLGDTCIVPQLLAARKGKKNIPT